jgi:hypothetical protein
MRIRRATRRDFAAIEAVYAARLAASSGLLRRDRRYWRVRRAREARLPKHRHAVLVAVDRAKVVGYVGASLDGGGAWIDPPVWLPERDGTDLGERLLGEVLRLARRWKAPVRAVWTFPGAPGLPAIREAFPPPRPPGSVFMAAILDDRAMLRDAMRVLRGRVREPLRIRVGNHAAANAAGKPAATVALGADILFGLLFGLRDLERERRAGRVRITPASRDALALVRRAFPPRRFWIQDAW